MSEARYNVGVDIGGTFTDVAIVDVRTGQLWTSKTASTPRDPSLGLLTGLRKAATIAGAPAAAVQRLVHGTTVATNAVLERKPTSLALVTTAGFRSVLEIGRHDVPPVENYYGWVKPVRPVTPDRIFEVPEVGDDRPTTLPGCDWPAQPFTLAAEILPDSGGPGRYRGGCGVIRDVRVLANGLLSTRMDNVRFPCWGVSGGMAGRSGTIVINPGTSRQRQVPPIAADVHLDAGDLLRVLSVGGGGWGDPFERLAERVVRDVREHFVSVDGARKDYGVVIDPNTGELDSERTRQLRDQPQPLRRRVDRGAATEWLREHGEMLD